MVTVHVTVSALRAFLIVIIDAQFKHYTQTINTIIMKPKETQYLGALITLLLALIVLDLYIIYSINQYSKLDQSDVTISFSIIDALFYRIIQLIVVSYAIFYIVVQIRGIVIQRERFNNKLQSKIKTNLTKEEFREAMKEFNDKPFSIKVIEDETKSKPNPIDFSDAFKDIKEQAKGSDLTFDRKLVMRLEDVYNRYGKDAYDSLKEPFQTNLRLNTSNIEKLQALNTLQDYYANIEPINKEDSKYWDNVVIDTRKIVKLIESVKLI